MPDSLTLPNLPHHPVNAGLAGDGGAVTREGPGRFGLGVIVPYYASGVTKVRARLRAARDARLSLEAHGFASRFQKIRLIVTGEGEVIHTGDELTAGACRREGEDLWVELAFRAHNTRNDGFYIFCDAGPDQFEVVEFTFEPSTSPPRDIATLEDRVHFEVTDLLLLRNYLQLDFELVKAGAELVALDITGPWTAEAVQWWTGRPLAVAADSPLTPRAALGPLASPRAMEAFGPEYGNHGHSLRVLLAAYQDLRYVDVPTSDAIIDGIKLLCRFSDGTSVTLPIRLAEHTPSAPEDLPILIAEAANAAGGRKPRFLELGGRGASSSALRARVEAACDYCAVDIEPGPNVDVVGDVHKLSGLFAPGSVDFVFSRAVMEHLLAPWQVVIEANRVLRTGGYFIAYVPTTWALHAEPWDFWRMSVHAWPGLLNEQTGFAIRSAREYGRAVIVPTTLGLSGATRMQHDPAPLFTGVIAQKIGEAQVNWDSHGAHYAAGRYTP